MTFSLVEFFGGLTLIIGLKLGRTEDAVRNKAGDEGISLKPTNQSPYNRRK